MPNFIKIYTSHYVLYCKLIIPQKSEKKNQLKLRLGRISSLSVTQQIYLPDEPKTREIIRHGDRTTFQIG